PQAARSRGSSRSQKATTTSATSTSASSSSSFRTSVSNRSKGPAKASRSSSSSRTATATRRRLTRRADAALRDRHRRPLRDRPRARRLLPAAVEELPPHEEPGREAEDDDRDPGVQ